MQQITESTWTTPIVGTNLQKDRLGLQLEAGDPAQSTLMVFLRHLG
jgi:hypothetical protein